MSALQGWIIGVTLDRSAEKRRAIGSIHRGFGLCVDRFAFDEALRANAVAAGATLLKGKRLGSYARHNEGAYNWTFKLASDQLQHQARHIVDCSGRQAAFAKSLGVRTFSEDRLYAFAQSFSCAGGDDDRYTRIEAAPYGWWYSSRLPCLDANEARRIVILHTDDDLPAARLAADPEGFDQLLAQTSLVGPLLEERGYRRTNTICGAPAQSQPLSEFCGDAWLAVGDAAQAYDPPTSQGIDKAPNTASHAGHLIHYALTDCPHGSQGLGTTNTYIRRYDEQQHQLWQSYEAQRNFYYTQQSRWSDQPFWQRRRTA